MPRRLSASIVANGRETLKFARLSLLAFLLAAFTGSTSAKNWPSGPIRWLVGFTAGGTADMISRDGASHLEKTWGQPVIGENRPGATRSDPSAALATAKPDGQTLMMILSGHITNAYLYPGLPF